jgi:fructose-1,6-bisphosphatase/inositol monophosphatase family enzyme
MAEFTWSDLRAVALLLRAAARQEIMPRFRRLGADSIRTKSGPLDLVTDADEAAEVGEEATAADPDLLNQIADAPLAFVVDPIDGTANFAAGLPLFGTMAAAIVNGEVVGSVIHDPVGDDMALALRGQGAWLEAPDGTRSALRVSAPAPTAQMAGAVSWRYLPEALRGTVCSNLPKLAASWDYRCAAHQYRMLAGGQCDFLFFNRLMPWDHAPGWLLHQEAGGYAAQFDGAPYRPTVTTGGLICAPDEASWNALRTTLFAQG